MSIIKSIKQVLGLSGTASENHFWDGSVPNQLSLKRGTPEAPGAELIKALNGILSFPNQGQSLTGNGYVKLPGGLIVQWGAISNNNSLGTGLSSITFPTPFPNGVFGVQTEAQVSNPTYALYSTRTQFNATTVSGAVVAWYSGANTLTTDQAAATWIAIGY